MDGGRIPNKSRRKRPVNQPVTVDATIRHLPATAARMVAIEILLADPEALGDDTLESGLYILREKLRVS
jgi:hypothetical protein